MKEGTDKIMNETQKYSAAEISSMGQTELESRAFIRTAASLNMIKEHWDAERKHLEEALDNNYGVAKDDMSVIVARITRK